MRRFPAVLTALVLSACSSPQAGAGTATPGPSPTRTLAPTPTPTPTPDPLAGMTVEQRVAQLVMVGFVGPALTANLRQAFSSYRFGAVVLDDGNHNGADPDQVRRLVADIRGAESPGPGPIVTTNQEGGTVCFAAAGLPCPPGQREEGANRDTARVDTDTSEMARGLRGLDLNSGLAPDADVWNGSSPFMGDRSFGTDPARVSELVRAAVDADHAQHVVAVAKHFPGHGAAGDSHLFLPTVKHDAATLHSVDLPPFQAAIQAGVDMVMVAHLLVPAIDPDLPTSLSPRAMTLLRQELGYQGIIITDDLMMGAIVQHYTAPQAAVMALQAGADMIMLAGSVELAEQAVGKVLEALQAGRLSQAQIDRSVRRVLALKARYGLMA